MIKKLFTLLLVLTFAFGPLAQPAYAATDVKNDATLPTNLVSYWELEEASGTRVDSHGANDLTDNNTVGTMTGVQGEAADFEHGNSETLSITGAGLNITGDISIAGWINQESTVSASGQMGIFSCFGTNAATRKFIFALAGTNLIRFDVRNSSGGSDNFQQAYTETVGSWVHVAVTWDASTKEAKFYRDGSQLGSTQTGSTVSALTSVTGYPYVVGGIRTNLDYWDGGIDDLGVWDKVLTSTEISALYNSGSGIPYDAGGAPPAAVDKGRTTLFGDW